MGNKRVPFEENTFYHFYNHGNASDNLFREKENYYYFLEKYYEYSTPIARTYAYCLMPNHFHFFIQIKGKAEIEAYLEKIKDQERRLKRLKMLDEHFSNFISSWWASFFNAYSKAFNKMYKRRGSLFLENVQRKPVLKADYRKHLVRYIHKNAVVHGFTKEIHHWPFSSYNDIIYNSDPRLLREEVISWFGGLQPFLDFHAAAEDGEDI